MSFREGTELRDILNYIKLSTTTPGFGVSSMIDPVGLREAERNLSSPVVIDIEGVPLVTTLRLILDQIGLVYQVKDGVLIISSPNRIQELVPKKTAGASP